MVITGNNKIASFDFYFYALPITPQATLAPECPVVLESGKPPRPRSS
jgi:hypothetical protein